MAEPIEMTFEEKEAKCDLRYGTYGRHLMNMIELSVLGSAAWLLLSLV